MDVGVSNRKEFRQVFLGLLVGLQRDGLDFFGFIGRHVGNELGRVSAPLLSRRNIRVGGNDRSRFENDIRLDDGAFQNGGFFSNDYQIVNLAGLEDTASANGHVVANVGGWRKSRRKSRVLFQGCHNGSLSDAGRKADSDWMRRICANNGSIPDAGLIPVCNLANHRCGGGDKSIVCDKGRLAQKGHLGTVS